MKLNRQEFKIDFAGKPLRFEVSEIAGQANAAILGQYGDTIVLATVVMGKQDKDIDYFPLSVEYEEKFYAAGKILGSRFIRREGRPSEEAVLSGRMIDRTLRPLFDHRIRRDVQIVITILSYDSENDPDFIALLTASTALASSQIPWNGPVAGVRIIRGTNGETIINPTNSQAKELEVKFDAFVSGTEEKINMIELSGNESNEDEVIESFNLAQKEIVKLIAFQKKVIEKIGKPKADVALSEPSEEVKNKIQNFLKDKLEDAIYTSEKTDHQNNIDTLKESLKEYLKQEDLIDELSAANAIIEEETDKLIHKNIIEFEKRPDGRKLDEVRDLYTEIGLFKRLHGSALFIRGNTQALAVTTLAAPGAEQLMETMEATIKRRFMLHYNFPPYSTGEIKRLGGPGRREIGHGSLAEKAVRFLIPSQEEFPYTMRVVSEILSSNGSSSMASVCATSLSLMDAGVPIKKSAAGIAMGLIADQRPTTNDQRQSLVVGHKSSVKYKILTDIQGPEDHYGDMDCKVAGTKDGITAIQMDVKIYGVTLPILKEVFQQAQKARLEILEVMDKTINKPKEQVSAYAPTILTVQINPEQIGAVIGPGGKMINKIIQDTGVETIDIEESGRVFVAAVDDGKVNSAIRYIKSLTREFHVGETVEGEIIKILDFGAIVDLEGGKDGMIHVSELKDGFVEKVEDIVKLGDKVKAKVIKVENGKIGLSLKAMKDE
ncbi:MAG TPA: polyribonucleotide nucleotidyltransferase [Candidatus Wolfebacteria bacterium]|nr:polyribonucleotide nucleotidyltransferase [Candidatus Wolfebacteria bacterium]